VLQKGAALLALAFIVGCGSVERAGGPEPVGERHLAYEKVTGETGIWIAEVDGSKPRLLVPNGHAPELSPDGKWLAYLAKCSEVTGRCSLHLVPTSGGKPRELAGGIYADFRWSPDSERIAASQASLPANVALVTIDVASGDKAVLAKGGLWGWSFSPDGTQIVFARLEDPDAEPVLGTEVDLFVAGVEGGDAKRVTDTGDAAEPVWGPKSIAYAKLISCLPPAPQEALDGCRNNTWGRHEIWQIQPDGTQRTTITGPTPKRFLGQGYLGLIPIDWSDNGHALLAGWLNEWGRIPVAVDPATGEARQLAENQASEAVALSADGKMALVETIDNVGSYPNSNTVLIAPYAGGKAHQVATGATSASWNR